MVTFLLREYYYYLIQHKIYQKARIIEKEKIISINQNYKPKLLKLIIQC